MRLSERGNVLFIILLMVILFAALSYAVTSSLRGNSKDASPEKASSQAAIIVQYASLVANTVNRLRLVNDCNDTQISFENSVESSYTNPNAPTSKKCNLFDSAGGGQTWFAPPTNWFDPSGTNSTYVNFGKPFFIGAPCVVDVGTGNQSCTVVGASDVELTMIIGFLTRDLCLELAKKTDTDNNGTIPIDNANSYSGNNANKFVGTYASGAPIFNNAAPDTSQSLRGRYSGCYQTGSGATTLPPGTYHFYQVLIAR